MERDSLLKNFHKTHLSGKPCDFDVFLAHSGEDKPSVEKLAVELERRRLRPWFDKWHVRPGRIFQVEIEDALPRIRAIAVFIGPQGLGPWQHMEVRLAMSQFVRLGQPIIPVLLPGVKELPADLPRSLCEFHWVYFGDSLDDADAVDQLEFGITGLHPRKRKFADDSQPPNPSLLLPKDSPKSLKGKVQTFLQGLTFSKSRRDASSAASQEMQPPAIPDYELIRRIGQGAYGEVWLARSVLGTFRAAKIIRRRNFADDRPFEREFFGIQKFEPVSRTHPGLVAVLHVGRDTTGAGFHYIMEVADDIQTGIHIDPVRYRPRTLASELKVRGRLPLQECLRVGMGLCDALGHLHQCGLIHRDIKPSNIIFAGSIPKLADIGLVTNIGEAVSQVGTSGFIPQEGPGSPNADIFSLGKVLYMALTGLGASEFPDLPTTLVNDQLLPLFLEINQIILKACEPDPRVRYQSAVELHAALTLAGKAEGGFESGGYPPES